MPPKKSTKTTKADATTVEISSSSNLTDDEIIRLYPFEGDLAKRMNTHMQTKAMWGGALEPVPNLDYWFMYQDTESIESADESIADSLEASESGADHVESTKPKKAVKPKMKVRCQGPTVLNVTPALYKIFDEIIVNCSDQWVRFPDEVTEVRVTYTHSGYITITNNGPGFQIVKHPLTNMFLPGQFMSLYLQGTNLDNSMPAGGGSHGIGGKYTNTQSDEFYVETTEVNESRKLYFKQCFSNRNNVAHEPTVIDLTKRTSAEYKSLDKTQRVPHTTIAFQPAYKSLGYPKFDPDRPDLATTRDVVDLYRTVYFTRSVRMAAWFASNARKGAKPVRVYFNDELIPVTSLKDYAGLIATCMKTPWKFISAICDTIKNGRKVETANYPLNLVIGVKPFDSGFESFSLVNGVVTRADALAEPLKKTIIDGVMTKLSATKLFDEKKTGLKLQRKYISDLLFMFMTTTIEKPQWSSQNKETIPAVGGELKYQIDDAVIDTLANSVKSMLKEHIIPELLDNVTEKSTNVKETCKYKPAKLAGRANAKCFLFLTEGDSAEGGIRRGMGAKRFPLDPETIGSITLGGVIPNLRKEVTEKETRNGIKLFRSEMARNNGFFHAIEKALGIKWGETYDHTNIHKLNYAYIVIATDQDTDGNFIKGLICNMFDIISPEILRSMIYVLDTPLIRATPPRKSDPTLEFSTQLEFTQWCKEAKDLGIDPSKYSIKYFKGLGSHDPVQAKEMLSTLVTRLVKLNPDEFTRERLIKSYGTDPKLRRKDLAEPLVDMIPPTKYVGPDPETTAMTITPVRGKKAKRNTTMPTYFNIDEVRTRSMTNFLAHEAKQHQKNDIIRKLPCVYDGMAETSKMILAGAIKVFNSDNTARKVVILGGDITRHMNYEHGEASLHGGIIHKAQNFLGGRTMPQLRPNGEFGTRLKGGKDAASARYIRTRLNKKLVNSLFPRDDDHLLEYVYEEGKKCQPESYIPIIPPITESIKIPATGWAHESWARDVEAVLRNTRKMVMEGPDISLEHMHLETYGFTGTYLIRDGVEMTIGTYELVDKNTVRVTELPLKVWVTPYVDMVKGLDGVRSVIELPSSSVNIEVTFAPGMLDDIRAREPISENIDAVTSYLRLTATHTHMLNYYNPDTKFVSEFKTYEEIMRYWYPKRHTLYQLRITREMVMLELRIIRSENIIRLLTVYKDLEFHKYTRAQLNTTLNTMKFTRIASSVLDSPGDVATVDLHSAVIDSEDASYTYLVHLRIVDITEENRAEEEKRLDSYRTRLEYIKSNMKSIIRDTWMEELAALERAIIEGRKTEWMYEDYRAERGNP